MEVWKTQIMQYTETNKHNLYEKQTKYFIFFYIFIAGLLHYIYLYPSHFFLSFTDFISFEHDQCALKVCTFLLR